MRLSDLFERENDVAKFMARVKDGSIPDYQYAFEYLNNNHEVRAGGIHSMVYAGASGDRVIKITPAKTKMYDAFYKFAGLCFAGRLWEKNPLFPKIYFLFELSDGAGVCIMERLQVGGRALFRNWETIDELVGAIDSLFKRMKGKTNVMTKEEAIAKIGQQPRVSLKQVMEYLTTISDMGVGYADINLSNVGLRKNGQLVIFDPVS